MSKDRIEHKFDFDRSTVVAWVANVEAVSSLQVIWSLKDGGHLVSKESVQYQVIPEIGQHTGHPLVDIVKRGRNVSVIIAAESQTIIDNLLATRPDNPWNL